MIPGRWHRTTTPRRPEPTTPTPTRIEIAVERDGTGHRLRRLAGGELVRPRPIADGPLGPRVALVQSAAALIGGDELVVDVRVGPGAFLELFELAATVALHARGALPARVVHRLDVAEAGRLLWRGGGLVAAAGSRVEREVGVRLGPGAALLSSDSLVLGRAGEQGGAMTSRLEVALDDVALHVEELELADPVVRRSPATLGGARVLGTVALYGRRAPDVQVLQLAGAGSVLSAAGAESAEVAAVLGPVRTRWTRQLAQNHEPDLLRFRPAAPASAAP